MEWEPGEEDVARQQMDCRTYTCIHMCTHTHTEKTAAAPIASLCLPGDCLAQLWPCDNEPFYFMHKSCAI